MDTTTRQSTERATLPVWGMVGVSLLVSVVVLGVFTRPVMRAGNLLAEINELREVSRAVDNEFGRYVQGVNTDLRGAGVQDPDRGEGLTAANSPPDLAALFALVGSDQSGTDAAQKADAESLFAQVNQTLIAENRSSVALNRHAHTLQEQQNAFSAAMLRLRSQIAQADGRAKLAAARAKAGTEGSAPRVSLQPLLVEALDLGLQVKDLDDAQDADAINNAINNQLEPSLARLLDLAAEIGRNDEKAAPMKATVESIVAILKGDAGSPGILAAYRERRRLDAEAGAIQVQGAAQLDRVRRLQEDLRALADTRTATIRDGLRDSLRTALRSAGSASVVGMLVLTALARVLAGNPRRQVSRLAESVRAQEQSRAQAEAALREAEALRSTVDRQSIVSVSDRHGRIIEVNEQFCAITGYTREELIGQDHRIIKSEHHPASFWAEVWGTLIGGNPWRGEVCGRAKDGSLFWMDSIIAPFHGPDGDIEKFVCIRNDITARKLAEEAMAASERRMRTIIDAEPECVKVVGPGGVLLEMNSAGLAMLEAESVEQIRELSLVHFVLPEYHAAFAAMHAGVFRGEPGRLAFEIKGLRGTRRWLDAHAVPLRNAAGEVEAVLAVTRDISEQRLAEAKAREADEFLRNAIDSLNAHTVVLDSDGRIRSVNRAWAEFASANGGAGPDAMVGGNYLGVCDRAAGKSEEAAQVAAAIRTVLAGGAAPAAIEYPCHAPREKRWFMCSVRGFSLRNERFAVISHLNITAIKHAEEELRKNNAELTEARLAADAASRAKSEFLANMSHEIRTPLTAILGFADILRDDGELEKASAQRLKTIETIRNAGTHLLTVINDILDISKIEADKMTVESIDTPLTQTLLDVDSLIRPLAVAKGIGLTMVLATQVPDRFKSDPTRLRQVLMNLAGNAVKFSDRGEVTLTVCTRGRHELQRLVIDIDDTGPGMTREETDRLFNAFCQADSTVTRKHGGTGLGLTISRRLAQLMGGDVTLVRTAKGYGSCFRLELPLIPSEGSMTVNTLACVAAAEEPKAPSLPTTLKARLILAEDGVDNQRLISFHLRKAGAEVDIAENGQLALEMIQRAAAAGRPYDLLVSDMQMPVMDGYTLARTLRAMGSPLPIIALTAHAMAEDRSKCMDAGCDDYATKPIDKAKLLATCAAWIGKARAASPTTGGCQ